MPVFTKEEAVRERVALIKQELSTYSSVYLTDLNQQIAFIRDLGAVNLALLGASISVLGFGEGSHESRLLLFVALLCSALAIIVAYLVRGLLIEYALEYETYFKGWGALLMRLEQTFLGLDADSITEKLNEYDQDRVTNVPRIPMGLTYGRHITGVLILAGFAMIATSIIGY